MRKHGRIDANHREVVEALEAMGASVQSLADIGNGCPDLLVGYEYIVLLMEVKDGTKPPSKRVLTPAQIRWRASWKGPTPYVVYSPQQATQLLRRLTGNAI